MTRSGHYTCALAVATIGVSLDPTLHGVLLGAGILAGCNAPDDLEFPLNIGGMRGPTVIPHRSLTHWPWSYAMLIAGALMMVPAPWSFGVVGICLGALLHLGIDSVSPHGIPWLSPFVPIKPTRALYRTWTVSEWKIIGPIVVAAVVLALIRERALNDAFSAAITTLQHRIV